MAKPTIFISYRRDDAAANAGRLFDWLVRQFGRERVFLDTDMIAGGDEFPAVLKVRLAATDVLLAVIGPEWLAIADQRGRRLDQPDDFVRQEVATALALGKRVIPVLVGGASVPRAEALPEPLRPLADRNAASIDEAKFERDFDQLVDDILGVPRGRVRRELDRFERIFYVAKWSSLVVPLLVAVVAVAAWTRVLDFFTLDTKVASYLMWAADAVSGPGPEPPVVIVAIDEATERKLDRRFRSGPSADWRRDHARLIDRAAAAGAAAVAFDIAFERDSDADGALAEAARNARTAPRRTRVVFGAATVVDGQPRLAPSLRDAAAWGSLCVTRRLGYTFTVPLAVIRAADPRAPEGRRSTPVVPADTPGLALAAAFAEPLEEVDLTRREIGLGGPTPAEPPRFSTIERVRSEGGECLKPGDEVATLLVRLSKPGYWSDPARRYSYADLLDPGVVPDDRLRGRIVLVGVTVPRASGRPRDVHEVVRGLESKAVHGVELHADAIANLVTGRVVRTPTVDLQAGIMLATAAAGAAASVYTATRGRGVRRWMLAGAVALYVLVALAVAVGGLLLNVLYDLAAFLVAYALLRRLQARRSGDAREELSPWAPSRA